jgi:hypothetical protein
VFFDEGGEFDGGFVELGVRAGGGVEDGVVEEFSGAVEDDGFAAGAEAGVDGDEAAFAEG